MKEENAAVDGRLETPSDAQRPGARRSLVLPFGVLVAGLLAFVLAVALGENEPIGSAASTSAAEAPFEQPTASEQPGDAPDIEAEPGTIIVQADRANDLVDGYGVFLTGTGFAPNTQVGALMCSPHLDPAEGIDRCMTSTFTLGQSDMNGRVAVTYNVTRVLQIGDREIDCATPPPDGHPTSCRVVIGAIGNFDVYGAADLTFDPDSPLMARSALEVDRFEGLLDGDQVLITIRNPGVGSEWNVMQCVTQSSPANCGGATLVEPQDPARPQILVSSDGDDIVAGVRLEQAIGGVDCSEKPDTCGLVVRALTGGQLHTQPLQFG